MLALAHSASSAGLLSRKCLHEAKIRAQRKPTHVDFLSALSESVSLSDTKNPNVYSKPEIRAELGCGCEAEG